MKLWKSEKRGDVKNRWNRLTNRHVLGRVRIRNPDVYSA